MFLFKAIYILFWTFVLNAVCKAGYKEVSWFLVLLPIILMFVILGMVLINGRVFEGFKEGMEHKKNKSDDKKGDVTNKDSKEEYDDKSDDISNQYKNKI